MILSLGKHIGLLALIGLAAGFGLFSWLGFTAVAHSKDDLLKERLTIAFVATAYLDETLEGIHSILATAINYKGGFPSEERFITAERLIRDALSRYGIVPQDIDVVDATGKVILDMPEEPEMFGGVGYEAHNLPAIREALENSSQTVSELSHDPLTGLPVVLFASPIFNTDGTVAGAIIAEISVKQLHLFLFDSYMLPGHFPNYDGHGGSLGDTGYLELVDASGFVLDRTPPGLPPEKHEKSDQSDLFTGLIKEKKSLISTIELPTLTDTQKYIIAFAPLSVAPWGLAIRQAESEIFDSIMQLQRKFILYGIVFLTLAVVLIWAGTQRLLKPVKLLTDAANKVGQGDFNVAVPTGRRDEIGRLAIAFKTMVGQLGQARDALSSLYQAEKEKQELRGRLLEATVVAQEDERKRIARELHDEFAQMMTALLMRLESLEKSPLAKREPIKDDIDYAKTMATQALEKMREMTFGLRPLDLDVLGLVPALRSYTQNWTEHTGVTLQFNAYEMDERLPAQIETALFRITQEAIRNVEKHAQATRVDIELEASEGRVRLIVEDDGKGFDVDEIASAGSITKSLGLIGIRERVELLGGDVRIESEPGKGTRITVTIPLPVQT